MIRDFSIKDLKPQTRFDRYGLFKSGVRKILFPLVFICVNLCLILLVSCRQAPTDLTARVPADTLIYIETNDLSKTLGALTENENFKKLSAENPDFSELENVRLAVAVTGFATSETQVTDDRAVLSFKPRFVAVAETNAWSWQAAYLVENGLNNFIRQTYGAETRLEKSEKNGETLFTWAGRGGRRIFALVDGSIIYFSNDEGALEKALAVRRGAAENLTKNEALVREHSGTNNYLAFGFVTSEGVSQVANYFGVSTAIATSDEEAPRNLIAKILPEMLKNTVQEITWTSHFRNGKIEDTFKFKTEPEISKILSETLVGEPDIQTNSAEFVPADAYSITRYNLRNPQIAWRSILLAAARQMDESSAKIFLTFSGSLFEPYGVTDSELFLSSIGSEILTVRFDADGEKSMAVAAVKDAENLKKALSGEINFKAEPEKSGEARIWKTEDGNKAAVLIENYLLLGDPESVNRSLEARQNGLNFTKNSFFTSVFASSAPAVTYSKEAESGIKIVEVLGSFKDKNQKIDSRYLTETRFKNSGFERKTVSDFGLLGMILAQF